MTTKEKKTLIDNINVALISTGAYPIVYKANGYIGYSITIGKLDNGLISVFEEVSSESGLDESCEPIAVVDNVIEALRFIVNNGYLDIDPQHCEIKKDDVVKIIERYDYNWRKANGGWFYDIIHKRWNYVLPRKLIAYDRDRKLFKDPITGLIIPLDKIYNMPVGNIY